MRETHPPADISLAGLAIAKHRSVPSGSLVGMGVLERHQLCWQRGRGCLLRLRIQKLEKLRGGSHMMHIAL